MKKEILFLSVVVLMICALTMPVLAEKLNKMPVAVALLPTGGADYSTLVKWVSDGGVAHLEYLRTWGTVNIYVNGVMAYANVQYSNVICGNYNPETMTGNWKYNEIWTLPGGTFEGAAHVTTYGGDLASNSEMAARILLHGSGDYKGQVLSMSFDWIKGVNTPVYKGYWLTPQND